MIQTMTAEQLRHAEKAIETAEALSVEVKAEIEKLKALDMKVLVKKVSAVMLRRLPELGGHRPAG
ncbi:hypothetical protein L4174_014725 [Photobacterium sp. CCB-ST2H9]|uniref:hypothetical protein n=1 Tax=Photobacterium sp. CCB-ST2H9 TaxID=2912855 RepID=UPI0020C5E23B|nr:hypothetical protein [Photobacterium sp. CCB-ST2H9]UTM57035.1 hypothetical protein L4174_014725 [Photobacterium sp. CCB-ST2H9]